MNQMGHHLPNMIGVDARGLDNQVRSLLPDYMTMGQAGMGGMTEMGMKNPPNSIPMVGGVGPKDEITMGGMFTILKVRENLSNYDEDPGWYDDPPGTLSLPASPEALRQNSIAEDGTTAPRAPAASMKSWMPPPPAAGRQAPSPPSHHHGHQP
jgi:manganese oxidase